MTIPYVEPVYIKDSPLAVQLLNSRHGMVHQHKTAAEVIYCLRGSCEVLFGARRMTLHEGDFYTLDFEDYHAIYSNEDNLVAVVDIDLSRLHNYSWDIIRHVFFSCSNLESEHFQLEHIETVRRILLALINVYATGSCDRFDLQKTAEGLIDLWMRIFSWPYKSDLDSLSNPEIHDRLQRINTYVQEHFTEKISVDDVARECNVSKSYFSQFMKKTSYAGFKEMVAYIRCSHAEELLLNTDFSGQEISDMCGFSSTKYFYKWFRRFWHTSPLQHKKWHKQYASVPEDCYVFEPEEASDFVQAYIADYYTKLALR